MNDSGCLLRNTSREALTLTHFNWLIALWRVIEFHLKKKTFLLIIRACLKICNIFLGGNEARLVMFNLASKFFLAKK